MKRIKIDWAGVQLVADSISIQFRCLWHMHTEPIIHTLACFSMYCLKSSSLSAELSTALYRWSVSNLSFTLLHRWPPSMCCSLRRSKKSCFTWEKKTHTSKCIRNLCEHHSNQQPARLQDLCKLSIMFFSLKKTPYTCRDTLY